MDLPLAFREIARVLRPGGSLLTRFGPLFRSPHGGHLYWACQVPYAHLLFGMDAIVALRERRGGKPRKVGSWQDLGLNGKRFDDYRAAMAAAGFDVVRFHPIPVRGTSLPVKLRPASRPVHLRHRLPRPPAEAAGNVGEKCPLPSATHRSEAADDAFVTRAWDTTHL
jgi:hypothetical protein